MDADTKSKVADLIALMDGISSEIDFRAEFEKIYTELNSLRDNMAEIKNRMDALDKTFKSKKDELKKIKKEMESILKD